jgi:hypothetical protein
LVSVTDPANWRYVSEVNAWKSDQPGVLAHVYDLAPPLNIVFAETVTIDSGSRHDSHLILEPFHPDAEKRKVTSMVNAQLRRIEKGLEDDGFVDVSSARLYAMEIDLTWMEVGTVDQGWVTVAGWQEALDEQAQANSESASYDTGMAVVSAETRRRALRYVFPRKGAVSVRITHWDRPGAMAMIARALGGRQLNILSSLLRRGSEPHSKAEVVMVVEPTDDCDESGEVERRVSQALKGLPKAARIVPRISGSINPEDSVLYPRRPDEIAVRPSVALAAAINGVRRQLPAGLRPIFISRRFVDPHDQYTREVVDELCKVLDENGCTPVQALPRRAADGGVSDDVKARMWASEAAILLVTSTPDEEAFSINLAHEWGFMQGQGKPLLPLVEETVTPEIIRNANLQGVQLTLFSREHFANHQRDNSIRGTVGPWLEDLLQLRRSAVFTTPR